MINDDLFNKATAAFEIYKRKTAAEKAAFIEAIGDAIMNLGDELIQCAMQESGLPEARLIGERGRTVGQLKLFADVLREGSWIEAVIDTALPDRKPLRRPDLRKMLVPVGPVLVFGAGNFPLAFSTAGGDTASALAAGNPVIVKAHEGHLRTHELVASAIKTAAEKTNMPDAVCSSIATADVLEIHEIVKHDAIKAVGFTGSLHAGTAIYKTASTERKTPIPVFAEMSSVNPVIVLPKKIEQEGDAIATLLAGSITLGVGQFCTNPGLIFLIGSPAAEQFMKTLSDLILQTMPAPMLSKSVCKNYYAGRSMLEHQQGVQLLGSVDAAADKCQGAAALMRTTATHFIRNEKLQDEVFGPSSLIVVCEDQSELLKVVNALHGQLTGTILSMPEELELFTDCVEALSGKVGRLLFNGVPTGVEVCHAMVHGGPYPATTFAGSTSVGADAIKRFTRPICFQDCPQEYLPSPLRDENRFQIMRKINGLYTRDSIKKEFA